MMLRELAHARAGDKGNTVSISVIAYELSSYSRIAEHVTTARVREWLGDIVRGNVVRYELPHLGALNFVIGEALGGGVTRSLAIDAHGKSLSSALLAMSIPGDE